MQVLEDIYPSRVYDQPRITLRRDPVVWAESSRATAGPLSDQQIAEFVERGHLFLPELFDAAEVKLLLDDITALGKDREIQQSPACIYEPSHGIVRSLFNIHSVSDLFNRLVADRRIATAAMQILGSGVYIHQSRVNLKPGFHGEQFYWHSDFETWHVEDGMPRMRAISCSILLTDNNPFNGPLMIVPGSHTKFVSCVGKTPEEHYKQSLRKQEYGVPDTDSLTQLVKDGGIVAPVGKAGSVLFFDCNVMHGSSGNISPWPRSNMFCVYNSVENTLVEPYGGTAPRPEFIAARRIKPVVPVDCFHS
jgi:ectoine hydroxylase